MAGKIDKELLKKHHFWFLFIPIIVALMVAWFGLLSEVDGEIEKTKTENEKKKNETKKTQAQPKDTLVEYDKQNSKLRSQKEILWKDGWERQKDLFVWPTGYSRDRIDFLKKFRFGEEIREELQVLELFQRAGAKLYLDEYEQLVKTLEPMQFRDKDWKVVLTRDKQNWLNRPDSEDVWLAMENLWVQRELLLAVHKVNADAAAFRLVASPDNKDDKKHRLFRSRTWELELWIEDQKGARVFKGKLKNISERLQVMGIGNSMVLKVEANPGGKKFSFEVQGTQLEAGQSMDVKTIPSHTIPADSNITEIASVRQEFDSRTVPVKRIDYLALGQFCDRDKDRYLRMALSARN